MSTLKNFDGEYVENSSTSIDLSDEISPVFTEGTIQWFNHVRNKGPLCLISYKNDSCKNSKKILLQFNLFYEELVALGYQVYGYTTQSEIPTKRLQVALLLKYPLISCQDISLPKYLKENQMVDVSISPTNISVDLSVNPIIIDYNTDFLLHPSILLLKGNTIKYSWAHNPNDVSQSKANKAPKVMHIMNKLEGYFYKKNSTPINNGFFIIPGLTLSKELDEEKNDNSIVVQYIVPKSYTSTCLPS